MATNRASCDYCRIGNRRETLPARGNDSFARCKSHDWVSCTIVGGSSITRLFALGLHSRSDPHGRFKSPKWVLRSLEAPLRWYVLS